MCNIIKLLLFVRQRRTPPLLPICNETNVLFEYISRQSGHYLLLLLLFTKCNNALCSSLIANYSHTKTLCHTPQIVNAVHYIAAHGYSIGKNPEFILLISNDPINEFACEIENTIRFFFTFTMKLNLLLQLVAIYVIIRDYYQFRSNNLLCVMRNLEISSYREPLSVTNARWVHYCMCVRYFVHNNKAHHRVHSTSVAEFIHESRIWRGT